MTEPTRPILRYFGGKWKIAPWVISHFPQHKIYVELFGGGASILLRKPRSYSEVYNDLNGDIVNVFRVMQSDFDRLSKILQNTPFARSEYELSYEDTSDSVEKARRTIVRSWFGFGSCGGTTGRPGFDVKSERSGNASANQWASYLGCLEQFRDRLTGVAIENRDALAVIDHQDTDDTLFFIDPPYVPSTRKGGTYECDMTVEDHYRLCDRLKSVKGPVVLCGYENEIYDTLGWHKSKMEAQAQSNDFRTEVLWMNERAWNHQAQASFAI